MAFGVGMRAFSWLISLVVVCGAAAQQVDPTILELRTLIQQEKWAQAIQLSNSLARKSPPFLVLVEKGLVVSSHVLSEVVPAMVDSERESKRQQWQEKGDKAFSNGDFYLAALLWQQQDLLQGAGVGWFGGRGKAPSVNDPAIWFRLLLLQSFLEFPSPPGSEEIRQFLDKHGDNRGSFLGKTGTFRELMAGFEGNLGLVFISNPTHPRLGANRNPAHSHGPNPYEIASWCSNGPWVKTQVSPGKTPAKTNGLSKGGHHGIHPASMVLGNQFFFHDETSLSVQDLKNGKESLLWGEPSGRVADLPTGESSLVQAAPNLLLAILRTKPLDSQSNKMPDSKLICVEAEKDGGKLIFSLSPPGESAFWEAGPVILENRAFVLMRSKIPGRESHRVLCYNLSARNPDLLWSTDLPQDSNPDPRTQLPVQMAAAGNHLFISSFNRLHALDVALGGISWSRSYPVDRLKHPASIRNRLLLGNGRVYHSASRGGWVECIDALTGRHLWKREMTEDIDLLGLCSGKLILEPSRGLRALDQQSGNDAPGWTTPNDFGNIHSIGRGFFAGPYYFWPTNQGHLVVHCPTGRPGADPTLFLKLGPGSLSLFPIGLVWSNDAQSALYANPGQWLLKGPPPAPQMNPVSGLR